MEECPIRVRALALDVVEKPTPELVGGRDALHGGDREGLPCPDRHVALEHTPRAVAVHPALGHRMLDAPERRSSHHGGARDRANHLRLGEADVDEGNLLHGQVLGGRRDDELLAHVVGSVAHNRAPRRLDAGAGHLDRHDDLPAGKAFREARRLGVDGKRLLPRRAGQLHLRGLDHAAVGERQDEHLVGNGDTAARHLVLEGLGFQAAAGDRPRSHERTVPDGDGGGPEAAHRRAGIDRHEPSWFLLRGGRRAHQQQECEHSTCQSARHRRRLHRIPHHRLPPARSGEP